jgi:hypothetical protein
LASAGFESTVRLAKVIRSHGFYFMQNRENVLDVLNEQLAAKKFKACLEKEI